jgi:CBS domain-containing protein
MFATSAKFKEPAMNATLEHAEPLTLTARTAADLMASNPVSLRANASVADALQFFTQKGITAAPIIDDAGHPIGVLSRSDLFIHQQAAATRSTFSAPSGEADKDSDRDVTAADLMTPTVFAVTPDTPARRVVAEMLALHVHRLFVVDATGMLVGVVSAMDVLRGLH